VGVKLFEDKIPIHPEAYEAARTFNLDPTMCMLNGGEDYEMLFTIKQEDAEQIRNHPMFSIIGYMTEDPTERQLIAKNGVEVELKAQGWQAFKEG
jgi:thiamine-monophosphate kinase